MKISYKIDGIKTKKTAGVLCKIYIIGKVGNRIDYLL